MANTCESVVRIYGSAPLVLSFMETHLPSDDSPNDFSRFLGEGESDCGAMLMDSNYSEGLSAQPYEANLYLYIDSRWNEPMDWFRMIIAKHDDLTFDISWGSAESLFAGHIEGVGGLVTKEAHRSDRDLTEDDLWLMGVGECESCDKHSVEVLFCEACPTCGKVAE